MVEYNVLTIVNQKAINEKAKTKNDGVYTFRGILYRVKDGRATHYACSGKVLMNCGSFNYVAGAYDNKDTVKNMLKKLED